MKPRIDRFSLPTSHGPVLTLRRTVAAHPAVAAGPRARPVLIVPGYGMNSFVFGFHPTGRSLEAALAARGLEVWSVDLRGQGASTRGPSRHVSLGDLAVEDLGAAITHVLAETATGADAVDLIGCSLGAALAFTHVVLVAGAPERIGSIVSLGGLVTWRRVHPLLRAAFASPWVAGKLRIGGTRQAARLALPALARIAPGLLSLYINARSTDLSRAHEMVQTVEDPVASLNREIAEWVLRRELVVRGVNVSRGLRAVRNPVLCVVGRQDGVVPEETARAVYDEVGSERRELLLVGTPEWPIAHADLFVAEHAEARIFAPIAAFLALGHAARSS